jgi:hypothetical protein
MAPAIAPIPPDALRQVLELYGLKIIAEDQFNWVLSDSATSENVPIVVPKLGDLVSVDIMMQAFIDSKMPFNTYLALKEKVLGENWEYSH